jgi:hypothetical protein
MQNEIKFRAIIEVLGKPEKHVEESLNHYLKNLEKEERFTILKKEVSTPKKQEKEALWATFAQVEVQTKSINDMTAFCLEYMPSQIEIFSPSNFKFISSDLSEFFSDLQSKLHSVDMVAKQSKHLADTYKKNISSLLANFIKILLSSEPMDAKKLSKLTGVAQQRLEDFLDGMIDTKEIDLNADVYSLIKKDGK